MQLSIIVPAYNAENTIIRCLDSIEHAHTSPGVEVIVINDGSTDGTLSLVENYIKSHKGFNLRVFTQENQGLSVVRNQGIKLTTGKYFTFVDSDDALTESALNPLLKIAEENNNPDWILSGSVWRSDIEEKTNHIDGLYLDQKVPEYILTSVDNSIWAPTWAKLYKRSIVEEHDLWFTPGMIRSQDTEFNLRYLQFVKRLAISPTESYIYEYNGDNNSTAKFQKERLLDAVTLMLKRYKEITSKIFPDDAEQHEHVLNLEANIWLVTIYVLYRSNTKHRLKWLKKIIKIVEASQPDWTRHFQSGNAHMLANVYRKGGVRALHCVLSVCRIVPSLKRKMRG